MNQTTSLPMAIWQYLSFEATTETMAGMAKSCTVDSKVREQSSFMSTDILMRVKL